MRASGNFKNIFITLMIIWRTLWLYRRKILESSIEIRELESKLRMAYILKERKKQIDDKTSARNYEKVLYLK